MTSPPKLVWDARAALGEGPIWVERDQALWFTDINSRKIHRYDPLDGGKRSWDSPGKVGFIVPSQSGGFIVGMETGLHRFDPVSGGFDLLVEVERDKPGNRLNDAVVDRAGRLWFGTMDKSERMKTGTFYCFHRGELRETGLRGIAITNGPAVSPDAAILYWVDTLAGRLFACPILDDSSLGESTPLIRIDPAHGHPDGPTVDRAGYIWIALYGGCQARRYSPAGELIETVEFAASNVTKLAIGGSDLRTAFATTARQKLDSADLKRQPFAGGLFAFAVETPGLASPLVEDR